MATIGPLPHVKKNETDDLSFTSVDDGLFPRIKKETELHLSRFTRALTTVLSSRALTPFPASMTTHFLALQER